MVYKKYHLRHIDALVETKTPSMASNLQQFVCATNWMRTSIPAYAERIAPLNNLLGDCYKQVRPRTNSLYAVYPSAACGSLTTRQPLVISNNN